MGGGREGDREKLAELRGERKNKRESLRERCLQRGRHPGVPRQERVGKAREQGGT